MNNYCLAEELLKDYIIYKGYDHILFDNYEQFLTLTEMNEPITHRSVINDDDTMTTIGNSIDNNIWVLLVMMYGDYKSNPKYGWIEDNESFLDMINSLEYQ